MIISSIPSELQKLPQWCICKDDKIPCYVVNNQLRHSSVANSKTWMTFTDALAYVDKSQEQLYLGFVLTKQDPYVCIDMDVKDKDNEKDPSKWTSMHVINGMTRIVEDFDTYSERSKSGKGLHVWCKGQTEKGCRRDGIELYSSERFIICTGQSINNKPIEDRSDLVRLLYCKMNIEAPVYEELVEIEEEYSDQEIIDMAERAENGDKYLDLCNGQWQKYGYPSPSEADLALMSMICFYSKSNEQCRRLFRASVLGKREKVTRNKKYLDYMIRLKRSEQATNRLELEDFKTNSSEILKLPPLVSQQSNIASINTKAILIEDREQLPWPPNIAGDIAKYIFDNSFLPIREVAITATLGLLAGISGRSYATPTNKDLSLYMILVAQSGIGKDAIHDGIPKIIEHINNPQAQYFIRATDFASGAALHKELLSHPGFLNLQNEFGRKLKGMVSPSNTPLQDLRTVMTNAYSKDILEGKSYSNVLQSLNSIKWPALSFLGETTPETFMSTMTPDMMEDGFMSRFLIIPYLGDRPISNKNTERWASFPDFLNTISQLVNKALPFQSPVCPFERTRVQYSTSEVERFFNELDDSCGKSINASENNYERQAWSRAHIKVLKIASLLAVIENNIAPKITMQQAEWAKLIVLNDINYVTDQYHSGNIGQNDNTRENKILHICERFKAEKPKPSYKVTDEMWGNHVATRVYFQMQVSQTPAFTNFVGGSNKALNATLETLVANGVLEKIPKHIMKKEFGYGGEGYKIM